MGGLILLRSNLSRLDNSDREALLSALHTCFQFIKTYQAVYLIHISNLGTMMNLAYLCHFPPIVIHTYADSMYSKITGKKKKCIHREIFFLKEILKHKARKATAPNSQELKQIQPARFRKFHTRAGLRYLHYLPTPERTGRNLSNSR